MGKYFHLEDVDSDSILVIILSCELTSVYWKELLDTLRKNHISNKILYFDFLYRNGYENRFFTTTVDESSRVIGKLRRCEGMKNFEMLSRKFFSMHDEVLSSSILSKQQIELFLSV